MDIWFELLYVAGFLITLSLLCLWLVKNKKTFYHFRNYILIPLTAIGGFAIYCIGYWDGGTKESLITLAIRSFLSTFHMFFLHSDLLEVRHSMHDDKVYMIAFSLIHFMAFLISFLIIIQLFGKQVLSWVKLKIARPESSYVFWDINKAAVTLAKDLAQKDKKRFIVFIDKHLKQKATYSPKMDFTKPQAYKKESLFEQISQINALVLKKGLSKTTSLSKLGINTLIKKSHCNLFLLSDDEEYNVQTGLEIIENIKNHHSNPLDLTIYINSSSEIIADVFSEKKKTTNKKIDIRIINRASLSAQELIVNHPPVDYIEKDTDKAMALGDFQVMILGLGAPGRTILRSLIEHGQFPGSTFQATAVDESMHRKEGLFKQLYPGLKNYCINYQNMTVGSQPFFKLLMDKTESLNYVVITLGDDTHNLQTAMVLSHLFARMTERKIQILAYIHDAQTFQLFKSMNGLFDNVNIFGCHENIFTEDIIIHESHIQTAKKIHESYSKQIPWDDLSEIMKATNISAATHIHTKLKMAGMDVEQIKAFDDKQKFTEFLGEERLENLAKGEHLHWNATLFTNGWDRWKLESIPTDTDCNKDKKHKKHACLVDWEKLDEVGKHFHTNYKEYDRNNVTNLYDLAKADLIPHP